MPRVNKPTAQGEVTVTISNQYIPGRRLIRVVFIVVLLSGLLSLWPQLLLFWCLVLGVLLLAGCVDGWRLHQLALPQLEREIERHWPLARWRSVQLRVVYSPGPLQLYDAYPEAMDSRGLPLTWSAETTATKLAHPVDPDQGQLHGDHSEVQGDEPKEGDLGAQHFHGQRCLSYQLRARQRGQFRFPYCDVVQSSPWALWQRRARLAVIDEVRVYPDYAELSLYVLLAQRQRLDQLGIHQFSRRGLGGDFHQLRDYRAGDALRQVDWKASARNQRLISREYQEDRDQQLLLLLDCGRRMGHRGDGRSHLDDALDAMLVLAFAALRQGDAVGMMSFAGESRWCAPRKGAETINTLLQRSFDLQARPVATDYLAIAQQVLQRQRRRSLIILLTNTRDEDYAELLQAARLLRRKHLVIIADLREALLDANLAEQPQHLPDALSYFATSDYLAARHAAHQRLDHTGVHILDVLPSQLAAALVNEYQRLKRSGQLAV